MQKSPEPININEVCETTVSTTECALACSKNAECKAYFTILQESIQGDTSYRCCLYRKVSISFREMASDFVGGTCGILESLLFFFLNCFLV
jgi:hypothetical protein